MQLAAIKIPSEHKFIGHKHLKLVRETDITQECWIVIKGRVKTFHYDEDDNFLEENILEEGDSTITFIGGHNYQAFMALIKCFCLLFFKKDLTTFTFFQKRWNLVVSTFWAGFVTSRHTVIYT